MAMLILALGDTELAWVVVAVVFALSFLAGMAGKPPRR